MEVIFQSPGCWRDLTSFERGSITVICIVLGHFRQNLLSLQYLPEPANIFRVSYRQALVSSFTYSWNSLAVCRQAMGKRGSVSCSVHTCDHFSSDGSTCFARSQPKVSLERKHRSSVVKSSFVFFKHSFAVEDASLKP